MKELFSQIPKNVIKQLRFVGAGLLVFCAILVPGAIWYKAAVKSMAQSSTKELVSMLNIRLYVLRQQTLNELSMAAQNIWDLSSSNGHAQLRRNLGFDLVVVFDRERKFLDGYRLLTESKSYASLNDSVVKHLVPTDTGFFDRVTENTPASGLMMVEGRPLLIGVKRVQRLPNHLHSTKDAGYLVVGRWLDGRRLASSGEQIESTIEMYSLSAEDKMPAEVRAAFSIAERSNGYTYVLGKDGLGLVYALLFDVNEQAAVIARIPWTLPWKTSDSQGFSLFYIVAFGAGVCAWGLLSFNDFKNRRRVRKFDGLASLSVEHIRTLVEAFPGYCFALTSSMDYVGVSRILSGVTGQEPSYFAGQPFGVIACESHKESIIRIFADLRDPACWPRVANVEHKIKGLGEDFEFKGMAHYLLKQDILFVILTPKESASVLTLSGHFENKLSGRNEKTTVEVA